jgi:hypothetical protein
MGSRKNILPAGSTVVVALVAWILASGCSGSGSGSDAAGGSGGEAGAGGAAPTCPTDRPIDGESCPGELACSYEVTPEECTAAQPSEALCVEGQWLSPAPASCGPLTDPSCDAVGAWTLTYDWLDTCVPGPSTLSITQSSEGIVFVTASNASLSADGCTLVASWLDAYSGDWGYVISELKVTLDFSGQPVVGTASYSCEGECACAPTTGTVTAVPANG